MFKSLKTTLIAGIMSASVLPAALAAPVTGYGADVEFATLYQTVLGVCGLSETERVEALAPAIENYSAAVVAADVPVEIATASFQELRDEFSATCGTPATDAIFEQLLPETEAIGLGNEGDTPGTPS